MTATSTRPAPPASRARPNPWTRPASPGRQRSRVRIAGAVLLIVLGCWVAAVAYLSIGRRREVVVVARTVPRFGTLTRRDLRVARVASESDVSVVPAGRLDDLVGRVTATDLTTGSLLSERELLPVGERPVRKGEAVVGALLSPSDSPHRLPQGASVDVIVRPAAGSADEAVTMRGWILDVADAGPTSNGARRVSLVVPDEDAGPVSAAAADSRVTVVVLGGS